MSLDAERTERDPLVVGMTRPLLLLGVTYSYFVIEGVGTTVLFLMGNQLGYLLAIIPLHLAGLALCRWDPRFFDVLFRVAQRAQPVPNRRHHRCNRYGAV
jgi:type IV secretion system protein VirB3